MKIGLFIDSYHPKINGVITSIDNLRNGLEALGHSVNIITGGPVKRIKESNGLVELPSINFPTWNCRIINYNSRVNLNYLIAKEFDVLHSNTPFTTGLLANRISKEKNIPNIHTYHTALDKYKDYMLHNFANSGDMAFALVNYVFCGSRIDEVIVPSMSTKDMLESYNINSEKITVIPTGYNHTSIRVPQIELDNIRHNLELSKSDFILLFVGRLAKEKGIDFLLNQQPNLNKNNKNIKLVIVGDGPEAKKLHSMTKSLNINNSVRFTGNIAHKNINAYYQMANLAVTASTTETQGLTIGEALINGLPVCCIDSEAFKTSVIDDYNGTYFASPSEYQRKIITLAAHQEILARWKNVNTKVLKTEVEYAEAVEKVYQKAIKRREK